MVPGRFSQPDVHATEPGADRANSEATGDTFCGPRCVQFVLDHYGRQEALRPLVEEIQERDWRQGSTLASLQSALERRGIYTAALKVANGSRIDWPEPMIVHLLPTRTLELGHFVVLLPGTDAGGLRVWCGLSGVHTLTAGELSSIWSGAVLLTSPKFIESPLGAVSYSSDWHVWLRNIGICMLAVVVAVWGSKSLRQKRFFQHRRIR
jgi:ABC-type bacteriocin/lantibiotic exporter with double-glycine peptidase domain